MSYFERRDAAAAEAKSQLAKAGDALNGGRLADALSAARAATAAIERAEGEDHYARMASRVRAAGS